MKKILISCLILSSIFSKAQTNEEDPCFMPDTLPTHQLKKVDFMKSGWEMIATNNYMLLKKDDQPNLPEEAYKEFSDIKLKVFLKEEGGSNYQLHFLRNTDKGRTLFMIDLNHLQDGSVRFRRPDSIRFPYLMEVSYTLGYFSKEGEYEEVFHEIWDLEHFVNLTNFSSKTYQSSSDQAPDGNWSKSKEYSFDMGYSFNGEILFFDQAKILEKTNEYTYSEDEEEVEVDKGDERLCDPQEFVLRDVGFVRP